MLKSYLNTNEENLREGDFWHEKFQQGRTVEKMLNLFNTKVKVMNSKLSFIKVFKFKIKVLNQKLNLLKSV